MEKLKILKKVFGYDSFRQGQEAVVDCILGGRDVLGIMPTGAGKSICYQLPALMLPGITIVVSPLISLMQDQVKSLNEAGIHAAYINSSLTENQITKALINASYGRYKIIYVAPERLETNRFLEFVMNAQISMITIDEAHCISQWGQDFRPSYLKIVNLIKRLPERPVVSAFTATATEAVKEDIICILGLDDPKIMVTGFDRPNLYFEVKETKRKDEEVLSYVREHIGESGIIYCATRKNVDKVYLMLKKDGVSVTRYHAGLDNDMRKANQEDFIYDRKSVVVATNAFGMGIDKSNVRYVIHYNMPQSIENYYQEAGRAGRDQEPAECILLYSPQDVVINEFLIDNKGQNTEFSEDELITIKENDIKRLNKMRFYCRTKGCLRKYMLNYFGEYTQSNDCGNCSNCNASFEEKDVTDICKDIISCIKECHMRYGAGVIAGILMGRNTARLRSYGVEQMQSYGIQKKTGEAMLKNIIDELLMSGYLKETEDIYHILKVTQLADEIVNNEVTISCKWAPAKEEVKDTSVKYRKKNKGVDLTPTGYALFGRLKMLRMDLARSENIPPYIVFSDRTLMEMCEKFPENREQMLAITGVGEKKYEKYGKKFMDCISEFQNM